MFGKYNENIILIIIIHRNILLNFIYYYIYRLNKLSYPNNQLYF